MKISRPERDIAGVRIDLDGRTIFAGSEIPGDPELTLHAAALDGGEHQLSVFIFDESGQMWRDHGTFRVEHVRLASPVGSLPTWRGAASIALERVLTPDEIGQLTISLARVVNGERVGEHLVYSSSEVPSVLTLDTEGVPDGTYDVVINVETRLAARSTLSHRVVVDNWDVVEDAILPPVDSGWFGMSERIRTVEKSSGWHYVQPAVGDESGDKDRIALQGVTSGYLTWRMPRLRRFEITAYADVEEIRSALRLHTSADKEAWEEVPYRVDSKRETGTRRTALRIVGELPAADDRLYLRVTLEGSDAAGVQIGHVLLEGEKPR